MERHEQSCGPSRIQACMVVCSPRLIHRLYNFSREAPPSCYETYLAIQCRCSAIANPVSVITPQNQCIPRPLIDQIISCGIQPDMMMVFRWSCVSCIQDIAISLIRTNNQKVVKSLFFLCHFTNNGTINIWRQFGRVSMPTNIYFLFTTKNNFSSFQEIQAL